VEEGTHLPIALVDGLQAFAGQLLGGDFAAREEIGQFGDSAFKHDCNSLKTILTTDYTDNTDKIRINFIFSFICVIRAIRGSLRNC
jgi:hypothetical protein